MAVEVCAKCKKQSCIKTGKLCATVNRILSRSGIKSADWIRPMMPSSKRQDGFGAFREVPFSSLGWDRNNEENDFSQDNE